MAGDPFVPSPIGGQSSAPKGGKVYLAYGDLWFRVRAHILDNILIAITGYILLFLLMAATPGSPTEKVGLLDRVVYPLFLCIEWLYYTIMECSPAQATFGKMWQGLKVTDLRGERLSFSRAAIRSAAKWLSQATFMLGYLMAMFNDRSQALHDVIAGTAVLEG